MGSDLTVVNAARVSFNKRTEEVRERDRRLLLYLAKNKHFKPFCHPHLSLHIKVPLFVARQLHKHQVGFSVSEVSRRYVSDEPELWWPHRWFKQSDDKKQGRSTEEIYFWSAEDSYNLTTPYYEADNCVKAYKSMLRDGVCEEQARIILPQNMYTEFHMTGSLFGWCNLVRLRDADDAQAETRQVAKAIRLIATKHFPYATGALLWDVPTL